jgi:hypothetical protein
MLIRLGLTAVAAATITVGPPPPATAVHETVWFRGGRVAPGLIVTEDVAGRCVGPARSTPRPDAWRCYADEHFIDPCFAPRSRSRMVLCPLDPWSTSVRQVELVRRLPAAAARPVRPYAPWGIWTANAKRCVIAVSGATLRLAGQRVRYECAGSGFLVGYANVRGRAWTIGYVPRYDLGNPHLHPRRVGITDVWR